ncbi:beta-lactamase superfamily II metal-dependent hydrolase [Chitinophaga niastensis]|uniref:Beta-lactamase superfamily II metal-dependent hydrolase n=1 Tax=Chitinophaga niastensis TaxID=536980 RepID=A0A2P8HDD6_CHINA|nr:hypothetical protein [Chitinophaga niastensis]PSL44237.1 beta-lactamase superfamily II metal-dependent hydrolase [Chitinophaga niastensis]
MFSLSLKKNLYSLICCMCLLLTLSLKAQEQLEIHHINVENGDATMILIHNTAVDTFPASVLIDGGMKDSYAFLNNYFKHCFKDTMPVAHFKYAILSHHHQDHYTGFKSLGDSAFIQVDTIIDVGGYKFSSAYAAIAPPDTIAAALKRGGDKPTIKRVYMKALKTAYDKSLLKSRSKVITSFPRDIGKSITIGTVNGIPVTLTCVAAAAYTYTRNGDSLFCGISRENNPNDYSLGFVLRYGEFRYFTGGDLGGENGPKFTDQETTLVGGLDTLLHELSYSFDATATRDSVTGHICAFKVSHHGSDHSTNPAFLKIRPAVAIVSAGNQKNWALPNPAFQQRLDTTWKPLSSRADGTRPFGVSDRGLYITNLYNFKRYGTERDSCLKYAVQLFAGRTDTEFHYGNDYDPAGVATGAMTGSSEDPTCKDSYILIVEPNNITTQSIFYLYMTNFWKGVIMSPIGNYKCHRNAR